MNGPYIRAAIKAEIRRAARAGQPIDRRYLRAETGLSWDRLERAISLHFVGGGLPPAPPAKGAGSVGPDSFASGSTTKRGS